MQSLLKAAPQLGGALRPKAQLKVAPHTVGVEALHAHLRQLQVGDVIGGAAGKDGPVAGRQFVAGPVGPATDAFGPVGQRHLVDTIEQEADLALRDGLTVGIGQAAGIPFSLEKVGGVVVGGELEQVGAEGELAVEGVLQPLAGQVERQTVQGGRLARARLAQNDEAGLGKVGERLAHVLEGHAGGTQALVGPVAETQGRAEDAGQGEVVAGPAGVGGVEGEAGQVDLLTAVWVDPALERAEQAQVGRGETHLAARGGDDDGAAPVPLHPKGGLRIG